MAKKSASHSKQTKFVLILCAILIVLMTIFTIFKLNKPKLTSVYKLHPQRSLNRGGVFLMLK